MRLIGGKQTRQEEEDEEETDGGGKSQIDEEEEEVKDSVDTGLALKQVPAKLLQENVLK